MEKENKELLEKIVAEIVDEDIVRPTCPPGIRKTIIKNIVDYICSLEE